MATRLYSSFIDVLVKKGSSFCDKCLSAERWTEGMLVTRHALISFTLKSSHDWFNLKSYNSQLLPHQTFLQYLQTG